jgi:hypothetical protein
MSQRRNKLQKVVNLQNHPLGYDVLHQTLD